MIVKKSGRQIPEIFEMDGEAAFRELERQALTDAAQSERCVISTGGGVPVDPANRALMRESGVVVRLIASPETILARLTTGNTTRSGKKWRQTVRPLLQGGEPMERIKVLLGEREEAYATADEAVDTEESIPEETAARVIAAWERVTQAWSVE